MQNSIAFTISHVALRLVYAAGLIIAGIVTDRNRKHGAICALAALVIPFIMVGMAFGRKGYKGIVPYLCYAGITTGTDACHFSPDAPCNRAQVVTFLHRSNGCPEPAIGTAFPDIPQGSFYHEAVLWAAQRQITMGMDGGFFRPELSCTRAQIVTFLYRDAMNP